MLIFLHTFLKVVKLNVGSGFHRQHVSYSSPYPAWVQIFGSLLETKSHRNLSAMLGDFASVPLPSPKRISAVTMKDKKTPTTKWSALHRIFMRKHVKNVGWCMPACRSFLTQHVKWSSWFCMMSGLPHWWTADGIDQRSRHPTSYESPQAIFAGTCWVSGWCFAVVKKCQEVSKSLEVSQDLHLESLSRM